MLPANIINELESLGFSAELRELLRHCLQKDPAMRPNFTEILVSDWFKGRVEETLSSEADIE